MRRDTAIDYEVFRSRLHAEFLAAGVNAPDCGLHTMRVMNGTKFYWRDMGGNLNYLAFAPPKLVGELTSFFYEELGKLRRLQTRRLPAQMRKDAA